MGAIGEVLEGPRNISSPGQILVRADDARYTLAARLLRCGVNAQPTTFHEVPERDTRLRNFLSSVHEPGPVRRLVAETEAAARS